MAVLNRIGNLAQLMKDKKAAGGRLVLMLGAGASLSSGVPLTRTIMEELVRKNAQGDETTRVEDRFDALWRSSNDEHRGLMLKPYLDHPPGVGYQRLAELVRMDLFEVIITFNFDLLLEHALDNAGFRDYRTLIRGETAPDAMVKILNAKEPRVKILKMHGSLQSADAFLFAREEMLNYPPDLERVISDLTGNDIIICGYAFTDTCVIRAFNPSKDGGSIHYVNPSGAVDNIKGFLIARRSQDKVIDGELGKFDQFMTELSRQMTTQPATEARPARHNLFKFLDYYQNDQTSWFVGRRNLTLRLKNRFERGAVPLLYLTGKPKVGKTSFILAGLIPALDPAKYECIYLRCVADVETQLRAELERRFPQSTTGLDWDAVFARISTLTEKRVVLFLDQFERSCRGAMNQAVRGRELADFVSALGRQSNAKLSVVFIALDDTPFWKLMAKAQTPNEQEEIQPLSPAHVARIIRYAARKGDVTLDPAVVETVVNEYREAVEAPGDKHFFTLLHVQTICYYLARGFQPPYRGYQDLPQGGLRAALETLKEESSLIDLMDDLPTGDRRLVRSFLKVICDPNSSTDKLIGFIRTQFPNVQDERFPEPLG
jgi:SIR2-like domain